jgi:transcriptional regulator with XRE-family HTH domain
VTLELQEIFRINLMRVMEDRGISAYRLAQMSGVSQATLSIMLRQQRGASLTAVQAIADALELPGYLMLVPGCNPDIDPLVMYEVTSAVQLLENDSFPAVLEFIRFQSQR